MIVLPRPTLFEVMFAVRGSIIVRIYRQVIAVGALSALLVLAHKTYPGIVPTFEGAPFALLGIALSVFLAFRNGSCYDRWWEARKHWGELIHLIRLLVRDSLILPEADRRELLLLAAAFPQALVHHIRSGIPAERTEKHLAGDVLARYRRAKNPPSILLQIMSEMLVRFYREGKVTDIVYQGFTKTIADLGHVQAACERISNTPLPFAYTLLLHRTAYTFCFLLPLGFADALGWITPLAAAFAAYTFFGLDALGDELEAPFGHRPNALPIEALANMLEINIREGLGEADLPDLPAPDVGHLLM